MDLQVEADSRSFLQPLYHKDGPLGPIMPIVNPIKGRFKGLSGILAHPGRQSVADAAAGIAWWGCSHCEARRLSAAIFEPESR